MTARDIGTYETTCSIHDSKGKHIGDIDVWIEYCVLSFGSPARVHYDENDHPAEAAEVSVIHVKMGSVDAAKGNASLVIVTRKPTLFECWGWLYDWAIEWADEHADDLAAAVRLAHQDERDANDDARSREARETA